jgi:hypothetical protein
LYILGKKMAGGFVISKGVAVTVSGANFDVMAELIGASLKSRKESIFLETFDPYIDGYMDSAFFGDLDSRDMKILLDAVTDARGQYLGKGWEPIPAWDRLIDGIASDERIRRE